MKYLAVLVACVGVLAAPGVASADSGSITNVFTTASGQVSATYTSTSTTCVTSGYCGWWPHAVQGPASAPCLEYVTGDGRLTYVGELQEGGSQTATETFFPDWRPVRICLYNNYGSSHPRILVAEYVHPGAVTAPAPVAPSPTPVAPAPTPVEDEVEDEATVAPLTISEARSYLADVLKKKFKSRFSKGTLTRSCYRLSREKVRCRVAWRKSGSKYAGSVTMWNDPDDPESSFLYKVSVKRIGRARVAQASLAAAYAADRGSMDG